jgi:superfamily I DNA and/or RNA helicase
MSTPPSDLESVGETDHWSRGATMEVKRKIDRAIMSSVCMPNPSSSFQINSKIHTFDTIVIDHSSIAHESITHGSIAPERMHFILKGI